MKVKAVEKLLKFDKNSAGVYRYVMSPEMYSSQNQRMRSSKMRALAPLLRYSGSTPISRRSTMGVLCHLRTFSMCHQPKGRKRPSRVFCMALENEGKVIPKPTILSPSMMAVTRLRSAILI